MSRWWGPWWLWIFAAFFIVGGAGYLSVVPECSGCACETSETAR